MTESHSIILGATFGVIAPLLGMFVGLQVSPLLANILLFPIVQVSSLLGQPIGMLGKELMVLYVILSMVFWAIIFYVLNKALSIIL